MDLIVSRSDHESWAGFSFAKPQFLDIELIEFSLCAGE